ncbi:hypothetical protein N431DRAFT_503602 [Stipitochalara longipes BDJ]|nr:hypothetical protein N431DRAFT_503602 [Stipitochalara longipes BDJ]
MPDRILENPRFHWEGPEFKHPIELVTFIVSKDGIEETFPVHKEHACYYSPVLKAAFTGSFIEGKTQVYRLEDTDPKIFRFLIQWIYKQTFKDCETKSETKIEKKTGVRGRSFADRDQLGLEPPSKEVDSLYLNMVGLYVLAERLIIPRLQNYIMGSLKEVFDNKAWSTAWMASAYEGTGADSPLRRFAVDMLLYQVPPNWKKEHEKHFPRELLVDLAVGATLFENSNGRDYSHTRVNSGYTVHETPYPTNVT